MTPNEGRNEVQATVLAIKGTLAYRFNVHPDDVEISLTFGKESEGVKARATIRFRTYERSIEVGADVGEIVKALVRLERWEP